MLVFRMRSRSIFGRRSKGSGGFTLVELLVVITILGILAAVVIAAVSGISDKGEESARTTDEAILRTAQEISCTEQTKQTYDDVPQLRRDGFLSSASGYNDVDLEPVNIAPDATCKNVKQAYESRYGLWTPAKTAYPAEVTITGCNGNKTTFTQSPKRVLAGDVAAYRMMLEMGLEDVTYLPSNDQTGALEQLPTALKTVAQKALVTRTLPTHAFPSFGDYPYLTANNIDLVVSSYAGFMTPGTTDSAFSIAEKNVQAAGFKTYVGYTSNDYSGAYGCTPVPRAGDGTPLAVDTLEGLFDQIRDLGTIFDRQEFAMKKITDIKTRMGDALLRGKAANGNRQVKVGVINQYTVPFSGNVNFLFGNGTFNAVIQSAGGVNPFRDQFSGRTATTPPSTADPNALTIARLRAAAPDVLVILKYGDAAATPNCTTEIAALSSWTDVPAVTNARYVCLSLYNFAGNTAAAINGILALSDKIATISN